MKKVLHGLMQDVLQGLEDNSVDAVVTDPPYGLKFMGKKWDYSVPTVAQWQEVFRVLKPGGHVLSFGGTRTYHRMVVNIEDAGFEIRDCIQWIYGSGFPKSMNISKAFDKSVGAEREVIGSNGTKPIQTSGRINSEASAEGKFERSENFITAPASDLAKQWDGWGTALKPANEPIVLARKPLIGTVCENIIEHGVGGINIDACRIGTEEVISNHSRGSESAKSKGKYGDSAAQDTHQTKGQQSGRFPSNVIMDKEAGRVLDMQSGNLKSGDSKGFIGVYTANVYSAYANNVIDANTIYADSGGASRFFYCSKASKSERNAGLLNPNTHPTVKPVNLMEYLIKLITPPNGIVLDPFAGSMTTGIACLKLGVSFIMIEADEEHYDMGRGRLKAMNTKLRSK